MTDLRSALRKALDWIGQTAHGHEYIDPPPEFDEWERLATSPLTVREALGDPEVRAGRVWVEMTREEHDEGMVVYRRWRIRRGALEMDQCVRSIGRPAIWPRLWCGEGDIPSAAPRLADLDAPCRLVPAEGDGG